MKIKPILLAATTATVAVAAVIIAQSTHAAAPDTTAPANPGVAALSSTNNPADAMAALFGDPVVASGTGVKVKRSDLDQIATDIKAAAAAQGETVPADRLLLYEARALQQMIDVQLLLQQASDADRAVGAKKADEAIATLLAKAGSQDTLNVQLEAAGTTEAQLRSKLVDQGAAMAALQRELGVNVTDADVQKYYDDHPQEFEVPEMVHVRHIMLLTIDPATGQPLTDDVVQEKRKQADGILAQARAGADFAKLAEEYSDDTATKYKGGVMTPFPRTTDELRRTIPAEFEAAAFSLTNNQISDVVETRYGYDIIQLIEKTPAKKLTLADTVPSSDTTIAAAVKEGLMQEKTSELSTPYLQKLKAAANVKILDPDLSAAVEELSSTNAAAAPDASGSQAAPPAPAN